MDQKSKKHFGFIKCFYCNQRWHHIMDYYYRNGTYVIILRIAIIGMEPMFWDLMWSYFSFLKLLHLNPIPCFSLTLLDPKPLRYHHLENDCFFYSYVGGNQVIFDSLIVATQEHDRKLRRIYISHNHEGWNGNIWR